MSGNVLVALLVTVVLGDVVEVFPADDDGPLHFVGDNNTGKDATTNVDGGGGEWALLVNVVAFNGFAGGLEAKSNILVPALDNGGLLSLDLGVLEDPELGLERFLGLIEITNGKWQGQQGCMNVTVDISPLPSPRSPLLQDFANSSTIRGSVISPPCVLPLDTL